MTQTITKRPTVNDRAVREFAADKLLPEFFDWAGDDPSDEEAATVRKLLVDGMHHHNGYEFAREFERAGWEPDGNLVDLLGNVDLYGAHRTLVKEWIAATGATPQLAIGAAVVLPAGRDAGVAGEIVDINDDGTYTVYCESLGHVRDGLGTRGRIFAWEAIEAATPPRDSDGETG